MRQRSFNVVSRAQLGALAMFALLGALGCGASQAKVEAPAPPKPPTEPMAWLPADANVVGHVQLAPFRDTPLWSLWSNIQEKEQPFLSWIDVALIDEVVLGGTLQSDGQPSFVSAVRGRFGEGYLAQLAARDQNVGGQRGLLMVYERPEAAWAQISPQLLIAFSKDRADAVVARAGQGDATPLRESPLYRSLALRVDFEKADLAVIADDASGQGKQALKKETARYGLAPLAEELVRAGVSLDMGPTVSVVAVAEAPSLEQAAELQESLSQTISSLSRNMFVGMLGLRPVLDALKASTEGNFVTVRGSIAEADLEKLLNKLSSVLAIANTEGAAPAP